MECRSDRCLNLTSEALKVGALGTRTGLFDYIKGSADTAIIRERGDLRDVDPKKERRKKEEWSRTGGSETRKEQLVIRFTAPPIDSERWDFFTRRSNTCK